MNSFLVKRIKEAHIHPSTHWLISKCSEFKGKYEGTVEGSLRALIPIQEMALLQSVESSNRIEGVVTTRERQIPLL